MHKYQIGRVDVLRFTTSMHKIITIHAHFIINRMFRVFGHNKVWVLDGGLPQWRASGFDLGSNSNDDAILKSKAANTAVETVYNGQMVRL
jgi:hypothetical protein